MNEQEKINLIEKLNVFNNFDYKEDSSNGRWYYTYLGDICFLSLSELKTILQVRISVCKNISGSCNKDDLFNAEKEYIISNL